MTSPIVCSAGNWCPPPLYCSNPTKPASLPDCTSDQLAGEEQICPEYHKCPEGSVMPTICPQGEYNENGTFGNIDCLECPGGVGICQNGQFTKDCLQGHYCTNGTAFPCPAGTFSTSITLTSKDECTICEAGKYCPEKATLSPLNCDAGFICLPGSLTNRPEALKNSPEMNEVKGYRCPEGNYCESGAVSETQCPPGTYRELDRGESVADCSFCPTGKYCEIGTSTSYVDQ